SLGTTDIIVQLWDQSGTDPVEATADASSITATDDDTVTIVFGTAPSSDQYRVVVLKSGGGGGGSGGGGSTYYGPNNVDEPPEGANDDEFDSTDTSDPISGWTTLGSPTDLNSNSDALSHLHILKAAATGTSWNGVYKTAPSIP